MTLAAGWYTCVFRQPFDLLAKASRAATASTNAPKVDFDQRQQKGLNPEDKAERVRRYAETVSYDVGVIAHSCGVAGPRELKRYHARIVTETGRSKEFDEIFPNPPVREDIQLKT